MITKLSSCRQWVLQATFDAWNKTGLPFLIMNGEGNILPLENYAADDLGFFYFVPCLARIFEISLIDALWFFDAIVVVVGVLIAITGFWCLAQTAVEKLVILIGIAGLSIVMFMVGNLYIAPFFAFSFFPWIFVLLNAKRYKSLLVYWVLAGFIIGLTGLVRIYAGVALGIAGLAVTFLNTKKIGLILACMICMTAGIGVYSYWFSTKISQRNVYLNAHEIFHDAYKLRHNIWHNAYIGLGFITNDLGLCYSDNSAMQRVKVIRPDVLCNSSEYDQVLKNEFFSFCKQHPLFLMRVVFAKLGVLTLYLFMFGNIGLLCAWFYRKPWFIELPYFFAFCFSALPGLLTVPVAEYLMGFFTVATFYGIHSIIWALQHGLWKRLKDFLNYFFKIAA